MSKKYGLILPEQQKPKQLVFKSTSNVFGDESDSDDEKNTKKPLLRSSGIKNRQDKKCQEKAISEDPTVYQYDELYDSMVNRKTEEKIKTKVDKKPKYIDKLLKAASKRKVEMERRIERQVQKEREKEDSEFADKEVFVTSAYKNKLEEMRKEEEKEKREEYLENIGDVTKQRDLGGFYRHLYEQKLGPVSDKPDVKEKSKTDVDVTKGDRINKKESDKTDDNKRNRNYRKRKSSERNENLSEGEISEASEEINRGHIEDLRAAKKSKQENIDADSDFSIDGSSDDETDTEAENKDCPVDACKSKYEMQNHKNYNESPTKQVNKETEPVKEKVKEEVKAKIDIWKKRTVGTVFEDCLRRYYERKSSRGY